MKQWAPSCPASVPPLGRAGISFGPIFLIFPVPWTRSICGLLGAAPSAEARGVGLKVVLPELNSNNQQRALGVDPGPWEPPALLQGVGGEGPPRGRGSL